MSAASPALACVRAAGVGRSRSLGESMGAGRDAPARRRLEHADPSSIRDRCPRGASSLSRIRSPISERHRLHVVNIRLCTFDVNAAGQEAVIGPTAGGLRSLLLTLDAWRGAVAPCRPLLLAGISATSAPGHVFILISTSCHGPCSGATGPRHDHPRSSSRMVRGSFAPARYFAIRDFTARAIVSSGSRARLFVRTSSAPSRS